MSGPGLFSRLLAVDDAVTALRRYSLTEPLADGSVSVHRLTEAVTFAQLTAEQTRWRRIAKSTEDRGLAVLKNAKPTRLTCTDLVRRR